MIFAKEFINSTRSQGRFYLLSKLNYEDIYDYFESYAQAGCSMSRLERLDRILKDRIHDFHLIYEHYPVFGIRRHIQVANAMIEFRAEINSRMAAAAIKKMMGEACGK